MNILAFMKQPVQKIDQSLNNCHTLVWFRIGGFLVLLITCYNSFEIQTSKPAENFMRKTIYPTVPKIDLHIILVYIQLPLKRRCYIPSLSQAKYWTSDNNGWYMTNDTFGYLPKQTHIIDCCFKVYQCLSRCYTTCVIGLCFYNTTQEI